MIARSKLLALIGLGRPSPAEAPEPDAVTHVIAYLPPYLLGRRWRRHFPDGFWDLQLVEAYDAGKRPPGGDWTLQAPGYADAPLLSEWASGLLGYPVVLQADIAWVKPGWLPFGRWHGEPVWWVRPL